MRKEAQDFIPHPSSFILDTLSLALLVLRLLADNPHNTFALDDFALLAHPLNGGSHFHNNGSFPWLSGSRATLNYSVFRFELSNFRRRMKDES